VLGAVVGAALVALPGIGAGFWGATGAVDLAAPFVCPDGTTDTHVDVVRGHNHEGETTNYYLDCLGADRQWTRVPTLELIAALYAMVALPSLALGLFGFAVFFVMWWRRGPG